MSKYYKPQRTRNLYDPASKSPFRLSRSKIDLFIKCPRCFYLDRRLGVGQPPSFPLSLNSAVDTLLKNEFDGRLEFDIKLIPYKGDDSWVVGKVGELYECLCGEEIPAAGSACDYCAYVAAVNGKSTQERLW